MLPFVVRYGDIDDIKFDIKRYRQSFDHTYEAA